MNDNNEVLLIRRSGNDYWEQPGGKIEFEEKIEDALKREIKEEVGVEIDDINLLNVDEEIGEKHWISLGFMAKTMGDKVNNLEPEKHDAHWFSLDELPKNLSRHTQLSIKMIEDKMRLDK